MLFKGVMAQIDDQKTLMKQVATIKEEQAQSMQEELAKNMESKLTQYYSSVSDMHEAMMRRTQNEVREQLREDISMEISMLQKELRGQAAVIKQQAAIMKDLQAAVVRQAEMAREQQRLLKEEW